MTLQSLDYMHMLYVKYLHECIIELHHFYFQDLANYGIDWNGPVSTDSGGATVTVPDFTEELGNPLVTECIREQLRSTSDNKIVRYLIVKDIARNLVH